MRCPTHATAEGEGLTAETSSAGKAGGFVGFGGVKHSPLQMRIFVWQNSMVKYINK